MCQMLGREIMETSILLGLTDACIHGFRTTHLTIPDCKKPRQEIIQSYSLLTEVAPGRGDRSIHTRHGRSMRERFTSGLSFG